ncbi:Protein suppressor of forked [Gryllus bimaculatus]|nr:Protein suppressor of forked [Gryllus bimaculatus]
MVNIERLWRDYVNFEQSINSATAEKMVGDRGREYMNARRVAKEFEAITRGLNRNRPSIPPSGNLDEQKQIELWKKYIAWEKSNPLRTEFISLVTRRVVFAFEQCLLCLGHHPEIWYDAARFLEKSSKILTEKGVFSAGKTFSDEASAFYERATSTWVKKNMLLVFAYADFEEERLKHEKVHQIYKRFLDIPDIDPTLAYVQYMKFARRAEGMKSARTVFKRSREDPRSKFHVFVAAALMEYYCSKDKNIAFRIFELGLKRFPGNTDYIQYYIDYLSHLNEESSTRALFEQILSSNSIEKEKSVLIWNRFLEFETNNGDMESITRVEDRRRVFLGQINEFEGKQTAMLVDRYKFLNLYPCTRAELKAMGYEKIAIAAHKQYHRSTTSTLLELDEHALSMPRPDFSQMIPFKPQSNALPGCCPAGDEGFQIPPAVAHLCEALPPPEHYWGPYVDVDAMIETFKKIQLPETLLLPDIDNGCTTKLFDTAKSALWILEKNGGRMVSKPQIRTASKDQQPREETLFVDSEDEDQNFVPPATDIYRVRQKRKMK